MSAPLNSAQCLCVCLCVCVRNEVRQPQHKANRFVRMGCLIRRVCQGWARQNRWMGNTFSMQSGNLSRKLLVVLYSAYRKRSPEIWDCALNSAVSWCGSDGAGMEKMLTMASKTGLGSTEGQRILKWTLLLAHFLHFYSTSWGNQL